MDSGIFSLNCVVAAAEERGLHDIAAAANRVWLFHDIALTALEAAIEASCEQSTRWSAHA